MTAASAFTPGCIASWYQLACCAYAASRDDEKITTFRAAILLTHTQGPDRLLGAHNSRAAYFPAGKLHYCAFGRLEAFQLACLYCVPTMIAAAWLVEV